MKISIMTIREQLHKTTQKIEAEMERLNLHRMNAELGGDHETAVWDRSDEAKLQEIDDLLWDAINFIDERCQE
ncbi:MAG: hypothetical protein NC184_05590 [Roseburia sp.]|nr:hypothetical protein [Roseburia sp.]